MIEIKDLNKSFAKLKVLKNINLSLKKGESIALIGPNGCGKTTFIKILLGMVVPTSGDILINGNSIKGNNDYRRKIGYMPQLGKYPDNMSIKEIFNLIRYLRKYQGNEDLELYKDFEIESISNKKMRTLSGGTMQKVGAAISFMFSPDILILDEPTAGIDPISSQILRTKILKEKDKGKMIIISSHLLNELDDMVSDVVFINEGKVLFHKKLNSLLENTGSNRLSDSVVNILKELNKE